MSRATLYAAAAAGSVVVVGADGAVVTRGPLPAVCETLHDTAVDVLVFDAAVLSAVVDAYCAAGQTHLLDLALRGSGASGLPVPLGVRRTGWACRWSDGCAQLPDGDLTAAMAALGAVVDLASLSAGQAAVWWARIHSAWLQLCKNENIKLKITLAATAASLGIPRSWRSAFQALATKGDNWKFARSAYYGGRVACLQSGWTGEAIEYDLRSAYGWALTQKLPDWKIYDRRPWASQPAWYDATVALDGGPIGPLPVRRSDALDLLQWPRDGIERAVWTRLDLDRATAAGARVLTVHRVLSGRWCYDLAPVVEKWLEKRTVTTEPMLRALYRALPNCLAGKLCQKSTSWVIWAGNGDLPPDGAVSLGIESAAWAVPVVARRQPVTCPQAGSYVTALVRGRVWPELQRPDAIYSDTDSIHLPAGAPPPADCGPAAGQWAAKNSGHASYFGPKKYIIGSKKVHAVHHLRPQGQLNSAATVAVDLPRHTGASL